MLHRNIVRKEDFSGRLKSGFTNRSLFEELLGPAESISVRTLTVLFTDLCDSTRLYSEAGETSAFGTVMRHFRILKTEIEREKGAMVKTFGDSVMASFQRPVFGLRAVLAAQEKLADPPGGEQSLVIKAGIHVGPCICVKFGDRFDYFGTTVNVAARLKDLSNGRHVVISPSVYENPEISEFLRQCQDKKDSIRAEPDTVVLKGFDQRQFTVWRVSRHCSQRVYNGLIIV